MSSIKTFCVRWIMLIAITAGILIPVSHATAADHAPDVPPTANSREVPPPR
jgi:hypothetical protein